MSTRSRLRDVAVSFGLFAAPAWSQAGPELGDWVIKGVEMPIEIPGERFRWDSALPLGDLDGDQMVDLLLSGLASSRAGLTWGPGWSSRRRTIDVPAVSTLHFSAGIRPLATLLRRPDGVSLLVQDARTSSAPQHQFFDVESGQALGYVPLPSAPLPGLPSIGTLWTIRRVGDVDGDGYEDAMFQTYAGLWCVVGVIDGQSMTVVWQHYLPDAGFEASFNSASRVAGWPDIDGDGFPDIIYCTSRFFAPTTYARTAQALSGSTGAVLWTQTLPDGAGAGALGEDINGDGLPEVLFSSGPLGDLQCLDGATGAVLWSCPVGSAQALLPTYPPTHFYERPLSMSLSAGTGALEVVIAVASVDTQTAQYRPGWLHIDAMGGTPTKYRTATAVDLQPWLPDPVLLEQHLRQTVGDLDRDGIAEMVSRNFAPSLGSAQQYVYAAPMAIWAQCTLEVPAAVSVGSALDFRTRIPSCPGRPALVVLSRGFDAAQGVVHGDWPLQMLEDGLFRLTAAAGGGTPPMWLVLDGTGYGQTSVTIPANAAYIGSVLYSKVVVPELSQPKGIYTTSTLGVTTITP